MPKLNLLGQKFGRLTVIAPRPSGKSGSRWLCLCSCGKETEVSACNLKSGQVQSCGCLASDLLKKRNTTHGKSRTRLYKIFSLMKDRCLNPDNKDFVYYGAAGVTICEEWLNDFTSFEAWARSHGYSDHLTIDRIDPIGDYCPENCQWITIEEQQKKRRDSHLYKGRNIVDWCAELGINYRTVKARLSYGWSIERALFTPVRTRRK